MADTLVSMLFVLFCFNFISSPGEKEPLLHFSSTGKIKEKYFHPLSGLGSRDVRGSGRLAPSMMVAGDDCVGLRLGRTRCGQEVNQILKSSS